MAGRALYLHFFDRELGDSVGARLKPDDLSFVLRVLALGTSVSHRAGLSLVWEHPSADAQVQLLVTLLVAARRLDLVSNHPTTEEFLESRRALYRHDKDRYRTYFGHQKRPFSATLYKPTSTTEALHADLLAIAESDTGVLLPKTRETIRNRLLRREGEAITYSLFRSDLNAYPPEEQGRVRRQISALYSHHYRDFTTSDIPTGIAGLSFYDRTATTFPNADVRVLSALLNQVGLQGQLQRPLSETDPFWTAHLSDPLALSDAVQELIDIAHQTTLSTPTRPTVAFDWNDAARVAARWLRETRPRNRGWGTTRFATDWLLASGAVARAETGALTPRTAGTVVVLVATSIEEDELLAEARRRGHDPIPAKYGDQTGYVLDTGRPSVVFKCEMGTTAPGAAMSIATAVINEVRPSAVVMCGIAFGVDPIHQPVGTVLIAARVHDYSFRKYGTVDGEPRIEPRGDPLATNRTMAERFRILGQEDQHRTELAPLISGPELIDNLTRRNELLAIFPQARGGDMESYGVCSAAAFASIPCAIVKAVCDWADGNKVEDKDVRQRTAAGVAAERVLAFLDF